MRCSLSSSHYAARRGKQDYSLEAMTALGIKYAAMQDGPEREDVLLTIVQAFHSYILKYVNMIMRGHLPTWRGASNHDSSNFPRRFLRPGDSAVNRESYRLACRTIHLAFKNQSADEIYNILAGLLIKVIGAYDPAYTTKIKMVAQAIDRLDASVDVITDEELDVDFNPRRFLRWMTRNGLLEAVRDPENNAHPIVGFRLAAWPPKPSVLNAKPIGLAYHIYRWFGSELQTYITSKMKEVETAEGLIQLDYAQKKSSKLHPAYKTPIGISTTDQGIPCATGSGVANPRSGKEYAFDTDLLKSELDLGRMNLRWVASNSDPLFEGLSRYERHILYLYFVQERSWKQIAKACRKGVKTVVEDYHAALEKAP